MFTILSLKCNGYGFPTEKVKGQRPVSGYEKYVYIQESGVKTGRIWEESPFAKRQVITCDSKFTFATNKCVLLCSYITQSPSLIFLPWSHSTAFGLKSLLQSSFLHLIASDVCPHLTDSFFQEVDVCFLFPKWFVVGTLLRLWGDIFTGSLQERVYLRFGVRIRVWFFVRLRG